MSVGRGWDCGQTGVVLQRALAQDKSANAQVWTPQVMMRGIQALKPLKSDVFQAR